MPLRRMYYDSESTTFLNRSHASCDQLREVKSSVEGDKKLVKIMASTTKSYPVIASTKKRKECFGANGMVARQAANVIQRPWQWQDEFFRSNKTYQDTTVSVTADTTRARRWPEGGFARLSADKKKFWIFNLNKNTTSVF